MSKGIAALASILAVFLASWEWSASNSKQVLFFASRPSDIASVWLIELNSAPYWIDFSATLVTLLLGYGCSVVVGYALGVSAYWSKTKGIDVNMALLILGSIPVFALAPLLILGLGVGYPVRIAVVCLSSVFLVSSGVYQAIKYGDEQFGSIARDLSTSDKVLWYKILLPSGLLFSIPSLKGAVALSLIGVFVAEWISSQNGLGKYILVKMSLYDSARLMVGILSFMLIASLIMFVISWIENSTLRWRNFR